MHIFSNATDGRNSNFSTFTIKLQSNRFQKQIANRLCEDLVVYRSIVYIYLPVSKTMGVILHTFPRNLCRIKNNKTTELQEKLAIVTGLCASREVACVASVSSRGSSRKLGQEQKTKWITGEGEGKGNEGTSVSPPPPPSTFFLLPL